MRDLVMVGKATMLHQHKNMGVTTNMKMSCNFLDWMVKDMSDLSRWFMMILQVDSEYQAGFTSPWWRYVGILNMSANPLHPFHVAVGNNKVPTV